MPRETVEDKLARMIGAALDDRERKQREASDPKARFDGVMGRLEKFLDTLEDSGDAEGRPNRSRRRSSGGADDDEDEGGAGDFVKQLFG